MPTTGVHWSVASAGLADTDRLPAEAYDYADAKFVEKHTYQRCRVNSDQVELVTGHTDDVSCCC